jgi:hypothetical protein
MEEIIAEVIIATLHCEMMVVSGSQYIISLEGKNNLLNEH